MLTDKKKKNSSNVNYDSAFHKPQNVDKPQSQNTNMLQLRG